MNTFLFPFILSIFFNETNKREKKNAQENRAGRIPIPFTPVTFFPVKDIPILRFALFRIIALS